MAQSDPFVIEVGNQRFIVREPRTPEEHRELMELEKEIWSTDYMETFPYHITIPLLDIGGVVLGVYEEASGRPIGMVIMMLGFRNGSLFYYSHMLGLLREYRGKGIGKKLKEIQREASLARGIELIEWTYEPLLSRNAWFNIVSSGVIVRRFKVNYYGITNFEYNRGIETDRFVAEWYLKSPRVIKRMKGEHVWKPYEYFVSDVGGEVVLSSVRTDGGMPIPGDPVLDAASDVLLVEIPSNFIVMLRKNMNAAKAWRVKTREAFRNYLSKGYIVMEVTRDTDGRYYYVLWRKRLKDILNGEYP